MGVNLLTPFSASFDNPTDNMTYSLPTTLPPMTLGYVPSEHNAFNTQPPAYQSVICSEKRPKHDFLQTIDHLIEQEIDNTALGIRELMAVVHLSHSQLFRRLKELTGKNPTDYIRSIRLRKALNLLCGTRHNVAEIAYSIGFTDPNYFSRAFRREFGQSPRAIRQARMMQ